MGIGYSIDYGGGILRAMNMDKVNKNRLTGGYTLVEVMVAMVITLIVMGGVYQAMVDENVNQDRKENILDMQNNARVAMAALVRDVRQAGFLGCGGDLAANTLINKGSNSSYINGLTIAQTPTPGLARDMVNYDTILDQLKANTGYAIDYLGTPLAFYDDAPAGHAFYAVGTDALTLVFLSNETMVDPAIPLTTTTGNINVKADNFAQDDILVATDCGNYSIFQKTNAQDLTSPYIIQHAPSTGLNGTSNDLSYPFGVSAPARIFKLNTATYFINKDNYDFCFNNYKAPIASNIEDLQFQFLFDADDDGDLSEETWQNNLGALTPQGVRAIRIWLLAMSEPDYGYTDNNTYDYPNSPYYTPNPNSIYKDAAGNLKPGNPYNSTNGGGGSPASMAPITNPDAGEHRHRYLASAVVLLRNAGL